MTALTRPVVTLFMSTSLNGMVARPDGSEGFLTEINWHAFVDLARSAGAVVWGRKTHEKFRRRALAQLSDVYGVVLTSNDAFQVERGWTVATTPEEAIASTVRAGAGHLLVVGGPTVNTAFAQRHLLDRVVLDIEAVVIGEGLPLFAVSTFDVPLRFREIKTLSPNVIQLHYDVISSV